MKDLSVRDIIENEENRQRAGLELIPSENYVSREVLEAMASVLTNKYSEGYPGARYYGGQQNTDKVEILAINRAKQLFRADHANVQPHSGASANTAVYQSWLEPGDTIFAMKLDHGGHLTHGHPVTAVAKLYNFQGYGIKNVETGEIDYQELYDKAKKQKPKMIVAGFSSYPRSLNYAKFKQIADDCGAVLVADIAHLAGLIAGRALENPLDFGFHIMTSTTHKTLRGPRGGLILSQGNTGSSLKAPDKNIGNLPVIIDRQVFPGFQGGPHMNLIAAKAVCFYEASRPEFAVYCQQVLKNAKALAVELQRLGFKLITGGTDNHLILIDIYSTLGINGRQAQDILDQVSLSANANSIPNDSLPAFSPSGLRIGTPAITTRGLKEQNMKLLAGWLHSALKSQNDSKKLKSIRQEIKEFATGFPLPSDS